MFINKNNNLVVYHQTLYRRRRLWFSIFSTCVQFIKCVLDRKKLFCAQSDLTQKSGWKEEKKYINSVWLRPPPVMWSALLIKVSFCRYKILHLLHDKKDLQAVILFLNPNKDDNRKWHSACLLKKDEPFYKQLTKKMTNK